MPIDQRNFELGWIPSDDPVNGRKNGLLRMDNLTLDEHGAVSLTRGINKINSIAFADFVSNIYSKVLSGTKKRYVALNNGSILSDTGAGSFAQTILSGGATTSALGSALGQVLCCSGTQRKKDDNASVRVLGIPIPGAAPTLVAIAAPTVDALGTGTSYILQEGANLVTTLTSVQFDTSGTTFRGVVTLTQAFDLTNIGGTKNDTPEDSFRFDIRFSDTSRLTSLRIIFVLTGDVLNPDDTYFREFLKSDGVFSDGINAWTTITITRADFERSIGQDSSKTWANVIGIRVEVIGSDIMTVIFDQSKFIGGKTGPLNGRYSYYQVDVFNSGKYIGKGPISAKSLEIEARNQGITVTPSNDVSTTVNEVWIYRKLILSFTDNTSHDTWYRVKVLNSSPFLAFNDTLSDDDALDANEPIDFFITSLPDNIIDMIDGLYFDRQMYLTQDALYPTKKLNIDGVDSRHILKMSGNPSELNLWIRKVSNSSCLIGTTNDIYELSGTGAEIADGTIDYFLRPLGIEQAPISQAAVVGNGTLFYMAADGWRYLVGSNTQRITGALNLLFSGFTRQGISPVNIAAANTVSYRCTFAKNKLWTTQPNQDGTRRCYVYSFPENDVSNGYWYPYFTDPLSLFTEEDGTLLGGYGGGSGNFLRIMDTGTLLDGLTKQQIQLLTVFDDGGTPSSRKDLSNIEIFADTGNDNVNIQLAFEGGSTFVDLGNFPFNGPTLRVIALNANTTLNLRRSLQLKITDVLAAGVSAFKFYYWKINYQDRPPLLNFLRLYPTNYGSAARKRFYEIPLSLDAIGTTVTFTPEIDGVAQATFALTGNGKTLYTNTLATEQLGFEVGGNLQAAGNSAFEFYDLIPPKAIEILPDRTKFFRIPNNDLGNSHRKRFIKLSIIIDTLGSNVTFTPLIDGVMPIQGASTINTSRKQVVSYVFTAENIGVMIGATLSGAAEFEYYGIDLENTVSEVLPPQVQFYRIPNNSLGSFGRKRFIRYAIIIDTAGSPVTLTPIVDGLSLTATTVNTSRKQTFIYTFAVETIGIDIGATLSGAAAFEFFGVDEQNSLTEVLPLPSKVYTIPRTNLGTFSRKRFIAFAFVIDTKGTAVTFTPIVDGVSGATSTVNTTGKTTFIHYFIADTVGIDIGGTLIGTADFEFYGLNLDETISEKIPPSTKFLLVPSTNFDIPAKKRVRTLPMIINTRGLDVTFTPVIDGVDGVASTINTASKLTAIHYFTTDIFGVDFGAKLSGVNFFEFYTLLKPEAVETLSPSKRLDQLGPIMFDKLAKLILLRLTLLPLGTSLTWTIYDEDTQIDTGSLTVTANIEKTYEIKFVKTDKAKLLRVELASANPFHRLSSELWHTLSGGETTLKKTKFK